MCALQVRDRWYSAGVRATAGVASAAQTANTAQVLVNTTHNLLRTRDRFRSDKPHSRPLRSRLAIAASGAQSGAIRTGPDRFGLGSEEIAASGTLPLHHPGRRLPRLSVDGPCIRVIRRATPFLPAAALLAAPLAEARDGGRASISYCASCAATATAGGADAPSNMQWQTKADAKAKDRWE
jgi:hypothetical protein